MKKISMILPVLALLGCQSGGTVAQKYNNWEKVALSPSYTNRVPSSDVDSDILTEGGRVVLEKCGGSNGYATMTRNYLGELRITVANVNCNYYKTSFMKDEDKISETAGNNDKVKSFVVREDIPGWHKLTIGSKSYFNNPQPGSKADEIVFYVPARVVNVDLFLKQASFTYSIPGCGGTVRAKKSDDGRVNVIFDDLQNCDTVTMYKDGREKTYKLQARGNYYGGSYSVPDDYVSAGSNWVNFQVFSKYKNEARIRVNFFDFF